MVDEACRDPERAERGEPAAGQDRRSRSVRPRGNCPCDEANWSWPSSSGKYVRSARADRKAARRA
ncbi:hypothetical protein NKH77_02750 [Streptomyces sp. M19]